MGASCRYDTQGSTAKLIGIIDGHLRHDGYDPVGAHHFEIVREAGQEAFRIVLNPRKPQ